MNQAEEFMAALRDRGRVSLTGFVNVARMSFSYEEVGAVVEIELGSSSTRATTRTLVLRCVGVVALRLVEFGGPVTQVGGLAVETVSKNQLEGLHWEVHDFESDLFRLLCRDVEIRSLSQ